MAPKKCVSALATRPRVVSLSRTSTNMILPKTIARWRGWAKFRPVFLQCSFFSTSAWDAHGNPTADFNSITLRNKTQKCPGASDARPKNASHAIKKCVREAHCANKSDIFLLEPESENHSATWTPLGRDLDTTWTVPRGGDFL